MHPDIPSSFFFFSQNTSSIFTARTIQLSPKAAVAICPRIKTHLNRPNRKRGTSGSENGPKVKGRGRYKPRYVPRAHTCKYIKDRAGTPWACTFLLYTRIVRIALARLFVAGDKGMRVAQFPLDLTISVPVFREMLSGCMDGRNFHFCRHDARMRSV